MLDCAHVGCKTLLLAAALALVPLQDAAGEDRYLWVDRMRAVTLGTVFVQPDEIEVGAETSEDLAKLAEFLEACRRGLIRRLPADAVPSPAPAFASAGQPTSVLAGTVFVRRILDCWADVPWAALSERTPREACQSQAGRVEAARALLGLERDMARQKRLGRAWAEVVRS